MIRDKKKLLLILLYVAVAVVAAFTGYRAWAVNSIMGSLDNAPMGQFQGNPDGQRVIVEFMDYRCSYCREIHEVVKEVIAHNPDVKVVYRHFPVFLQPSVVEADIALAAGIQGKFEQAHEYLISRDGPPITAEEIDAFVLRLGLDKEKFRADMKSNEVGVFLLQNVNSAQWLGIKATPTFVIGDLIYRLEEGPPGMPTRERFELLLDEAYGGDGQH